LAGQVAIVAFGLVLWRATGETAPPLPAGAVLASGATIETGLLAAERQSVGGEGEGEGKARLLHATMQVDWPWEPPPSRVTALPPTGWLTYAFLVSAEDQEDDGAAASVLIDRLTGEIVAQDRIDWPSPPGPPRSLPTVSSTTALLAAEAAVGTAFRRACPAERHLTRVAPLLPAAPSEPATWLITYEDSRQRGRPGLTVRVDGTSAAVLAVEREVPTCSGEGLGRG